jgi:hypothetical protein
VFAEAEATPTAAPYPPPLPRGSAPDPISKKQKKNPQKDFFLYLFSLQL